MLEKVPIAAAKWHVKRCRRFQLLRTVELRWSNSVCVISTNYGAHCATSACAANQANGFTPLWTMYGIFCLLTKLSVLRRYNLFQVVFLFKWYLNTLYRALYIFSLIKNRLYIVYEVADVSLCVQTRTQLPSLANAYANVWIWVQRQVIIDRITHAQLVPERKQAKLGANGKNIC